ncbi:MAG: hypothetical protein HDR27_08480 [Lachnospiraceae bacterium]|nr:hypothetical protein [Lachnospiraceae bacterium]
MKRKVIEVGIVLCLTAVLAWMGNFSAADAKTSQNESEVYTCVDAPDGSYRAETAGEESIGGWIYPELVQVRDLSNGEIVWSETAYMDPAFFWSEDGNYLVIRASGRTWTECRIIDAALWQELDTLNVASICALTEDFPDIYENGITAVRPLKWLSSDTLLLEIYWDGAPYGEEAVTGTVEYEIDTGSYRKLNLQLESIG